MRAHSDPIALKYSPEELFHGQMPETRKLRSRCLSAGFYARHLERWLDFFSPRQLIIIDGLELREEPATVMDEVISMLNLPKAVDYKRLLRFDSQKGFFCVQEGQSSSKCLGKSKGRKYDPMSAELRQILNGIFELSNKELLDLLRHYKFKTPSFLKEEGY